MTVRRGWVAAQQEYYPSKMWSGQTPGGMVIVSDHCLAAMAPAGEFARLCGYRPRHLGKEGVTTMPLVWESLWSSLVKHCRDLQFEGPQATG